MNDAKISARGDVLTFVVIVAALSAAMVFGVAISNVLHEPVRAILMIGMGFCLGRATAARERPQPDGPGAKLQPRIDVRR